MFKCLLIFCSFFVLLACERVVIDDRGDSSLPTLEIEINEKYLWSPDSGLYVVGNNGIEACSSFGNYNQKWEYPAVVKYSKDGQRIFKDTVGFRIKGNCSRGHDMKSFGLYWRKRYGTKDLDYQMFSDLSLTEFKRLMIRNTANDHYQTHIKDAAISSITQGYANVEYQEYQPCVLYLNKEYWGIYAIREMITPHFFASHFQVNADNVDLLVGNESSPRADDGSAECYIRDVVSFAKNNDLSLADNYEHIITLMDVESYIDYIIINTYIAKCDWPGGNGKWWRDASSTAYKKWRWVTYDADRSFRLENVEDLLIGELYGSAFESSKVSSFFLFNQLIKNDEFRASFLDRYLFFIDVVFEKKRVEYIIRAMQEELRDEYTYHRIRWQKPSEYFWDKVVDDMVKFNEKRNDFMRDVIYSLQNEK